VATYIENDPALRQKRYVAGITYKEMGALALRLGLRDMEITKTNPDYEICVRASHKAYCAINNKPRSFNLSAVFLPTDEFIFNFRSHGGQ
jgi:hypothetical protein